MFTALIALFLLFLMLAALPFAVSLIYKVFYDRHLNRCLQEGKPVSKWLAPIGLFAILFALEIIVTIGGGLIYSISPSTSEASIRCEEVSAGEIDQTILNALDGEEAAGFSMQDYSTEAFTCQVYTNTQDALLPAYVIRLSYTGDKQVGCWDATLSGDFGESGFMGDFEDPDDKTLYFLISNEAMEAENFTFSCNLYEEDMDAYSTGNLGTIVTPDPQESFSINVP